MSSESISPSAMRAAEALFTNSSGQTAERLVLTSIAGRDLGGWSAGAVRDQISAALHLPEIMEVLEAADKHDPDCVSTIRPATRSDRCDCKPPELSAALANYRKKEENDES